MRMELQVQSELYLKKRLSAGMAEGSAARCRSSYLHFAAFLQSRGINDLRDVDEKTAFDFLSYLHTVRHYRTKEPLSFSSLRNLLGAVRLLYKELYLEEKILVNPFQEVSLGRQKSRIPRDILSEKEIDILFDSLERRYGLFGLAVGEILYGTGIRASELRELKIRDVNLKSRTLFVRNGKGRKDRVVPIPEGTASVLRRYKKACKPSLWFFESSKNRRVSTNWIRVLLHRASEDGEIGKNVTPHGIRHTFSTHLLAGGMDLRLIQQLLGHENIATTEIYARIRNEDLFRVYRETHPRA